MLRFFGGVVVMIFVLSMLGFKITIDTTDFDNKTAAVVHSANDGQLKHEFEAYKKMRREADEQNEKFVKEMQEKDREQTVSENPADNGGPVSEKDYQDVMENK